MKPSALDVKMMGKRRASKLADIAPAPAPAPVFKLDDMNQVAINRFDDAVGIQAGACNMSGVTRSLVRCINQCRAENVDVRADAAIRMIVHQMAFLCKVAEIDTGFSTYSELTAVIEAKAAEYKAKAAAQ